MWLWFRRTPGCHFAVRRGLGFRGVTRLWVCTSREFHTLRCDDALVWPHTVLKNSTTHGSIYIHVDIYMVSWHHVERSFPGVSLFLTAQSDQSLSDYFVLRCGSGLGSCMGQQKKSHEARVRKKSSRSPSAVLHREFIHHFFLPSVYLHIAYLSATWREICTVMVPPEEDDCPRSSFNVSNVFKSTVNE